MIVGLISPLGGNSTFTKKSKLKLQDISCSHFKDEVQPFAVGVAVKLEDSESFEKLYVNFGNVLLLFLYV